MTPAAGLKRLGFALLAVVAVGGALLAAGSVLLSAETVRQQALSEIRSVTGLDPILRGPAEVSLFPNGSVSFADVALGDAKNPALTAERLTARLRFFPLLIGRVEIADVSLERPHIAIDLDMSQHPTIYDYVGMQQFISGLFDGRVDVIDREALKPRVAVNVMADLIDAF